MSAIPAIPCNPWVSAILSRFNDLYLDPDPIDTTHWYALPNDKSLLQEWIATKYQDDMVHPLTQEMIDSVTGTLKV
jgi:hypothetical protein